jgi:hypothetical protein
MAQSGYTPILIYASGTATNVPLAANMTSSASGAELALNYADGKLYYKNSAGTVTLLASTAGAAGDVVGPASATDNALARFDLTTGKLIQNSVGILSDAGILTGLTGITSSGSITFSSLTSGRVPYATTAGLLTDSANLLYSGTDLTVYGLTVGRGGGAVSTNTAVGASAIAATATATRSTAIGFQALTALTSGDPNTAVGAYALKANTTGAANVGVGAYALQSNTNGGSNAAFGNEAMSANTTGTSCVAVGALALYSNTTASNNTAVGYTAGYSNTTGSYNTFVGGADDTGKAAGYTNTAGNRNTAMGAGALGAATTASDNTAFGQQALRFNTAGETNSAFGQGALYSNTTGSANTAIGRHALLSNTTTSNNTAVGYQALYTSATNGSQTAVGYRALYVVNAGFNNTAVGASTLTATTSGHTNTAVGDSALAANTTGASNVAMGQTAGGSVTTGGGNTLIGSNAGAQLTTATYNTFIGGGIVGSTGGAGFDIVTGSKHTIVGRYSGNQGGLDIRTASNYIVLSDGDGNPRAWIGAGNNNDLFRVGTVSTSTNSFMHSIQYSQNSRYAINFANNTSGGNPNGVIIDYPSSNSTTSTDNLLYCGISTGVRAMIRNDGGLANFQANNANISDRREKTNFAPAKDYLDVICAIPVQTFNYIDQDMEDNPGLTLGVVAQDVQTLAPELVTESNWGTKENPKMRLSIYQTDLQYALMKCIQEQQAIITALTARVEALESN